MRISLLTFMAICLISQIALSQNAIVEGYVFEDGGRGYLNQVKLNIYNSDSGEFIEQVMSNQDGFFTASLPKNTEYKLKAVKDIFEITEIAFATTEAEKLFLKVTMKREEGYLFEVTLAPKRESEDITVDAITGALIEVYNNTKQEEVLVLADHPSPDFKIQFKKGNHYTVMVRKEGYLVKRMEAFVNVEGCILCFEGVGEIRPGVTDNLTEGLSMGTLLANVELEPIYEGKIIELSNIYYEFGKATLTDRAKEELRQLARILEDNKHLTVELGSHTDVRGTGPNNKALSDLRAEAAVDYLTKELSVRSDRIIGVGYGESQIKNKCKPGITCTDEEHAENRRTEMKILALNAKVRPLQSLSSMKKEEAFEKMVLAGGLEQIKVQEESVEVATSAEGEKVEKIDAKEEEIRKESKMEVFEEKNSVSKKGTEALDGLKSMHEIDTSATISVAEMQLVKASKSTSGFSSKAVGEEIISAEKYDDSELQSDAVFEDATTLVEKRLTSSDRANKTGFTGYRIVIYFSTYPVTSEHEIFTTFEGVQSYTTKQKSILYLIGSFKNFDEAEDYRIENVVSDSPSSYVVGFLNGQKITIE